MNVSIIVPAYNEAESLPELVSWINRVVDARALSTEIIIMDDGSKDNTKAVIADLQKSCLLYTSRCV